MSGNSHAEAIELSGDKCKDDDMDDNMYEFIIANSTLGRCTISKGERERKRCYKTYRLEIYGPYNIRPPLGTVLASI